MSRNQLPPPEIRPLAPHEASQLMAQSTALQVSLYPPESIHLVDPEIFTTGRNALLGAIDQDSDTAIGCVGVVREGQEQGTAEIKRLFVAPEYRGRGVATALMNALEALAIAQGVQVLRLETGIYQPESRRLYASRGYQVVPPFGQYTHDPLSVFMEKVLRE
jgi:putative acetyltransferase